MTNTLRYFIMIIVIGFIGCVGSTPPSMPQYATTGERQCGRECQLSYSVCKGPCAHESKALNKNTCYNHCNYTLGECYGSCKTY